MTKKYGQYVAAFMFNLVLGTIIFGFFMAKEQGLFSLSYDFDSQLLPFTKLTLDALHYHTGIWNWNLDMGADIVNTMSYYTVGSPFFWLFSWCQGENTLYILGWEYVLKYAVAGFSSYCYLRRYTENNISALTGSVLYAFSGFQAVNLIYSIFHDAAAFLPFMLLAMEELVERDKKYWFALTVAVNALVNYYCFIGEVIFLVIYFIIRYLIYEKGRYLKKLSICLAEGIHGVLMASVLLAPSIISVLQNSRVQERIPLSLFFSVNKRDLMQLFTTWMLPGEMMMDRSVVRTEDWSSKSAYLPMIGIALFVCYMLRRKKHDWLKGVLAVNIVFMLFPICGGLFSMYMTVYSRWYYMAILFIVLASVRVVDDIGDYPVKSVSMIMLLLIIAEYAGFGWWHEHKVETIYHKERFMQLSVIALTGFMILLIISMLRCSGPVRRKIMLVGVSAFAVITTSYTVSLYQHFDGKDSRTLQNEVLAVREVAIEDGVRCFTSDDNLGMTGAFGSTYSFISTINGSIPEFWESLGLKKITFSPIGAEGTNELLSVKYVISDELLEEYECVREYSHNDMTYYLYELPQYLNIGYTYDQYILKEEFARIPDELRPAAMLCALVVDSLDEAAMTGMTHIGADEAAKTDISAAVAAHKAENAADFKIGKDTFSCRINASDNKYAFFSVPYDSGWSASVNGHKADIIRTNGMMAVQVEKGENLISFCYVNRIFVLSAGISLVMCAVWLVLVMKKKRG